jgi:hypothetical protein
MVLFGRVMKIMSAKLVVGASKRFTRETSLTKNLISVSKLDNVLVSS